MWFRIGIAVGTSADVAISQVMDEPWVIGIGNCIWTDGSIF